MKCPYCGAEVTGDVCEYCGSQIKQTTTNAGQYICPECGGQNTRIEKISHAGVRISMGVCNDCGHEWNLGSNINIAPDFQRKISLILLGLVFCFPIPVTYFLWKTEKLNKKMKYILIGVVWAVYLGVFILPQLPFWLY